MRTLTKSRDKVIAGVCGGVAEYFGWDPSLVRIVWAVACCFGGTGLVAYVVAAIVMPESR